MAKLENVSTIDMQDGEITKVSYQGEEYSKVGGESREGDIVRAIVLFLSEIEEGDFFEVDNRNEFRDASGFVRDANYPFGSKAYEVFRKSPAAVSPPFAEMITAKVSAVEERVSALEVAREPAKPTPTLNEGDCVKALRDGEFDDVKAGEFGVIVDAKEYGTDPYYIEVKRDSDGSHDYFRPQDLELAPEEGALKVGDYAVVTGGRIDKMELGDIVKLVENAAGISYDFHTERVSDERHELFKSAQLRKATDAEVAKATAPAKPTVSDIVVITGNTNYSRNKVGDIGKVVVVDDDGLARVKVVGGPEVINWTLFAEMRHATLAEVERYYESVVAVRKKAEQADKDTIFTKAGRKPNEYRKGDLVRVTAGHRAIKDGDIGEIFAPSGSSPLVEVRGSRHYCFVEIVCFAEDRKDAESKGGR